MLDPRDPEGWTWDLIARFQKIESFCAKIGGDHRNPRGGPVVQCKLVRSRIGFLWSPYLSLVHSWNMLELWPRLGAQGGTMAPWWHRPRRMVATWRKTDRGLQLCFFLQCVSLDRGCVARVAARGGKQEVHDGTVGHTAGSRFKRWNETGLKLQNHSYPLVV